MIQKNYRPIFTVAILLSIIFLPYWIYAPLLLGAIIYFRLYWEGIFLAFIIDALYGHVGFGWEKIFSSASFWALLLLAALLPLRRIIRSYA